MLTLKELHKWVGITPFELFIHFFSFLISSIMLALKLFMDYQFSYWQIFVPLFIASGLNLYFLFIIFIRTMIESRQFKSACVGWVYWSIYEYLYKSILSLILYMINNFKSFQLLIQHNTGINGRHIRSFIMSQDRWRFRKARGRCTVYLWGCLHADLAPDDSLRISSV